MKNNFLNVLSVTMLIIIGFTSFVNASTTEEKAMLCTNPKCGKLNKNYIKIVVDCLDNNKWIKQSINIGKDKTEILFEIQTMPYFIVNGFYGSAGVTGPTFYSITEVYLASIPKQGELICEFQAATDEEPPILSCFDSLNHKWVDVRNKNIQGEFITLRDWGTAMVIIKNNKVVNFEELMINGE